ncbi:MAG TPA: hypothetical protein VH682_12130 [Gemmataceae bacterium]|jgi:uncharacterized protein YndB with AHSA1/START domain
MRLVVVLRLAFAALLLFSFGCSSSNKGKIEDSKWTSLAATVKGETLAAGARYLEFNKDSKMVYTTDGQPHPGTYSLGLGPTVTFNLEKEMDGRKVHPQKIVIDGDRLILTDPDGSEVTFQRVH